MRHNKILKLTDNSFLLYTPSYNDERKMAGKHFDFSKVPASVFEEIEFAISKFSLCYETCDCIVCSATPSTKKVVEELYDKYEPSIKLLREFKKRFDSIKEDDHFCILSTQASGYDKVLAKSWVLFNSESMHTQIKNFLDPLIAKYRCLSFGYDGIPIFVGSALNKDKVCRFCGKTHTDTAFGDKRNAHAIPNALGNRLLFCTEECKDCNNKLSSIEMDLVHLMDFRRSYYGIRNKDNELVKIIGQDFVLEPRQEGKETVLYVKNSVKSSIERINGVETFKINHSKIVHDHNVYKALVKMVIDLLPNEELCHFRETIRWIRREIHPDYSPFYMTRYHIMEDEFVDQPIMELFIRKQGTPGPYCTARLFVCDVEFLYIVPLVDVDGGQYKYDDKLRKHFRFFTDILGEGWNENKSSNNGESVPWFRFPIRNIVQFVDDTHKVFEDCKSPHESRPIHVFPKFDYLYPSVRLITSQMKQCNVCKQWPASKYYFEDCSIEYESNGFASDLDKRKLEYNLSANIFSTNRLIELMSFSFHFEWKINNLSKYVYFKDDERNEVLYCPEMLYSLITHALAIVDQKTLKKRQEANLDFISVVGMEKQLMSFLTPNPFA